MPFLFAHDSATTYLPASNEVYLWTKTQPNGGFPQLLDCGARALDLRLRLDDNGVVKFHHGVVPVDKTLSAALDEVIAWAAANSSSPPKATDLLILAIDSCTDSSTGSCMGATREVLASRNVTLLESSLAGMRVADAISAGRLPAGGAMLVVNDNLVDSHYVPSVACSGYGSSQSSLSLVYRCYADAPTKAFPLNRMWSYLDGVTNSTPPSSGNLYSHQCLWQESDASVELGTLAGSSLLGDEHRSGLNALVRSRIQAGSLKGPFNLFEVNDVCDGGGALVQALLAASV